MIEALELYTGEFLADFGEEEWVQAERAQLKKVYSDALKEVSEYLLKNEEFDELQKLTSVASELYPFDEWQAVQMQALIGLERYKGKQVGSSHGIRRGNRRMLRPFLPGSPEDLPVPLRSRGVCCPCGFPDSGTAPPVSRAQTAAGRCR